MISMPFLPFTIRLQRAIDLASHIHMDQFRKDPDLEIPYAAHVFSVSMMMASHDAHEDVVIAALFHDVKEDRREKLFLVEQFGGAVMGMVDEVSEVKFDMFGRKIPWAERKSEHSERLRTASIGGKMISCGDKIHNMNSLVLSCERGPQIWKALASTPGENIIRWDHLRECLIQGWCEDDLHPLIGEYTAALDAVRNVIHI
jgi:(p)ppGpp synthase/HD superfamily hydrolase